jgi:hypothetical protein
MSDPLQLLVRYRGKGVLVDANLLLLYFIGQYDRRRILSFKRTKMFIEEDFDLLLGVLRMFGQVVTTPNILTEVSNLSGQLELRERPKYFSEFAEGVLLLEEEYLASAQACSLKHFEKLGLTDSGIVHLANGRYLVLTIDFKLWSYLQNVGIDAVNFNHLRPRNWN